MQEINDDYEIDKTELIICNTVNTGNKSSGKGFPGGAVVESLPASAGDTGSSPGQGGSHMPRSN